ncbi:hypothetical protein CO038_03005 [Candidatus Pacearchaeota archaeon CG_4_9_14_0_2_um_filter_39_13]|nr:hypothetical protein [Candidatus Pacearchaeota archaeon]OIO42162.1 MAG: hypothetical protein AUJ64_04300 [Candidatus Pacearchaeota archaeon CG1_02_39_14]PJC44536.1 MAG: hypothetical protein CO038_03005 [Candidatus Pacearchaeota archaeon CG_4_9_14_0_2_um_filter_39_13]
MNEKESIHLIIAIILLAIVISFKEMVLDSNFLYFGIALLFSFIIILVNVTSKKVMAGWLDASVEHRIWFWKRFGFKPHRHLKKEIPLGAIIPLIFSAFSLGFIKIMSILTYETSALKRRAARRQGYYSYTEMTDFHISLIGAAGILGVLVLSFISYWFQPLEELARIAAFYAFWNMIPVSKLDGTHILFGSKVIWTILAAITLVFTIFAILLGFY